MTAHNQHKTFRLLGLYYASLAIFLGSTAMHIPDGYLSPVTSIIMFLLLLPFWIIGIRKIRQSMNARSVPLIALVAAFSFVIMMFNVPLPGGTTGHAVGAALAAVVLGPEIAVIAISMALIIQAFFFGDGGILAIGANCFNMAVVVPYLSAAIYRAISRSAPVTSPRRIAGAAIGGWTGLTTGALFAGIEFGLQPLLFKATDGSPLYAPYPLSVAVPAMVIPHMAVASVIEGLLTALVVAFLQRSNPAILEAPEKSALSGVLSGSLAPKMRWVWVLLGVLVVASPLGLLAPGTAWGEWSASELAKLGIHTIPRGFQQLSTLWGAPLARYNLPILGNTNLGYILSALVGIAVTAILVWLFTMLLAGRGSTSNQSRQ